MNDSDTQLLKLLPDTTEFLIRGSHHHARLLHACGKPKKKPDDRNKSIADFARIERLAGQRIVPRNLPLNILVVENKIGDYPKFTTLVKSCYLWCHLENAHWYIRDEKFNAWEKQLREDKGKLLGNLKVKKLDWSMVVQGNKNFDNISINYSDIDLILQDVFLDEDSNVPLGFHLTEHYFDLMPQAMVFLLTAIDIDYLAATGKTHKADRVISKHRMGCLWWYYYQAFISLYGRIFWNPWCKAPDDGTIADRKYMRKLFGCLRRWRMEPEILWHGQNLPEMIDHGHPHVTDLWRLTDDIIGTAVEKSPFLADELTAEDRILLALGVWLHDIGHRGDQFNIDPMAIRDAHGAISERLLLSDPKALGLEWLEELCTNQRSKECGCNANGKGSRLKVRNRIPYKADNGNTSELCPLRKVGLLCRAHQSSAPIWPEKLPEMWKNLKFPGSYGRLGYCYKDKNYCYKCEINSDEALKAWFDSNKDLNWIGSDIRCMEDFKDDKLVKLICLLRWLDALHVSRVRTGTYIHQATHRLFLEERKEWCTKRLRVLKLLLEQSPAGSKSYLAALAEQIQLLSYGQLLDVQDIHLWRHDAVDRISVEYEISSKIPILVITYHIFPKELSAKFKSQIKQQYEDVANKWNVSQWTGLEERFKYWAAHVFDDVILSEVESQRRNKGSGSVVEELFCPIAVRIDFRLEGKSYLLWPLKKINSECKVS